MVSKVDDVQPIGIVSRVDQDAQLIGVVRGVEDVQPITAISGVEVCRAYRCGQMGRGC